GAFGACGKVAELQAFAQTTEVKGVKDFSVPVGLDAKVKVDLVVVGSVAVSEKEKLEKIPVLKKVRALEEQAGKDVTLGTQSHAAEAGVQSNQPKRQPRWRPRRNTQQDAEGETSQESRREKKGEGEQKARQQPVRVRKESRGSGKGDEAGEAGKVMKCRSRRMVKEQGPEEGGGETMSQRKLPQSVTTVYLGGIPAGLRVSELKAALRERKAAPLRLTWQGAQHRAFLDYSDPQVADQVLEALQGLSLNGHSLQVELAKSQRGQKRSGQGQKPSVAAKSKTAPPDTKIDTAKEAEQ
ncbi:hypothetical protein XENOCAPTIV_027691, partial [Xenoophorus captivus]